jgi:hypothetical protein
MKVLPPVMTHVISTTATNITVRVSPQPIFRTAGWR